MENVLVMSLKELADNYVPYKDYEKLVMDKETKEIFSLNNVRGSIMLIPFSNQTAMEKIEKGLHEFAEKLKRDLEK